MTENLSANFSGRNVGEQDSCRNDSEWRLATGEWRVANSEWQVVLEGSAPALPRNFNIGGSGSRPTEKNEKALPFQSSEI